ncbi:MAG: hypothetical protein KGR19_07550 [Acidobacteria bacterium]|nr:hypothetical protein [Acidobacteriota bacterium]
MSADDKSDDEPGGLSNEPLPGSGANPSQPEQPADSGAEQPPAAPPPPAPPAPPAGSAPPPPPPAPAAAAPAGATAPAGGAVAPGPGQPGLAIAAFVCGLISILTSWCCIGVPLGVAAVVCGIVAKGEVERRGVSSWMWITGLVLGALSLAVFAILLIIGAANTDWNFDTSTN